MGRSKTDPLMLATNSQLCTEVDAERDKASAGLQGRLWHGVDSPERLIVGAWILLSRGEVFSLEKCLGMAA